MFWLLLLLILLFASVLLLWPVRNTGSSIAPKTPDSEAQPETSIATERRAEFENSGTFTLPPIHFRANEARITNASAELRECLVMIAERMHDEAELNIMVIGHSDKRGSRQHNLELSLARARAVQDLLTSDYGVAPERLRAIGRGFSEPVSAGTDPESHARNRRVVIQVAESVNEV